MTDIHAFAGLLTVLCGVAALAIVSSRVSEMARLPAPAVLLVAAAALTGLFPALGRMPIVQVQRVVTVALVLILFDGGMDIGLRRFRRDAAAIAWLGVAGTLVTAAALAIVAHLLFGLGWYPALLLAAALSPTDPAVVFSVLGGPEVAGRSVLLLKGESGANDPVGIALMTALLSVGGLSGWAAVRGAAGDFGAQMLVGLVVGAAIGSFLAWSMPRLQLPSQALFPLWALAAAGASYGLAILVHGSGFLAVFVCGIVAGDVESPFRGQVAHVREALASLGEIVAFIVLGLTVSPRMLVSGGVLGTGLAIAALLALVIRPVLVGMVLAPVRLAASERAFVLWAGLKGAVPILLGTYLLSAGVTGGRRLYGLVFVVVTFSVLVQGGLVPVVARLLRLSLQPSPE